MADHQRTRKTIFDKASALIGAGLSSSTNDAQYAVRELEKKQYDFRIFFNPNIRVVKEVVDTAFENIDSLCSYEHTNLTTGRVSAGRIGRLSAEGVLIGEIVGLKNPDIPIKLVARVLYPYEEKNGFFLSSSSAEEVHKRGKKTLDEKESLHRIEFDPFLGNYVLGMYLAWHDDGPNMPLILYANTELDRFLGIRSEQEVRK